MNKVSKEKKEELAASAFKDAPGEALLHVTDSGTVLNNQEYDALKDKSGCDSFKNPNKGEEAQPTAGDPEATAKLEAAEKEIERLNELKSVKDAKAKLAAKDAEIADLKKQIEELTKS